MENICTTDIGRVVTSDCPRKAKLIATLRVRHAQDKNPCWITGLTRLSELTLVVVDKKPPGSSVGNNSVKHINPCTNRIVSTMSTSSEPFDVTKVTDEHVAVTLPIQGILQLINVDKSGQLVKDKELKVGEECAGVVYSDQKFIVSYGDPYCCVKVLDMTGTVLNTLGDSTVFTNPQNITLSSNSSVIYVTDADNNTVTSMTTGGLIMSVDKLPEIGGVTVDHTGCVYVCGVGTNTILQLTSGQTSGIRVLLDKKQGVEWPESITYCWNTLHVGMYKSDIVKVFQIRCR